MISMCGFRTMGLVSMPVLPDFSFDRLLLMWIILMFIFQVVTGRERLKGPFVADALILVHTIYILVQILVTDSAHFHNWVISNLSPFFAYLYGKYTINRDSELRNVLLLFLAVTIYFYLMSIAQQMNWNNLIWPKTILDRNLGLWHEGRSRGPVLHPPYFGQLLGMFLLVQLFLLVKIRNNLGRVLLVVSTVFSFIGLFFTYTRGPWLATTCALIVLAVLRPHYRKMVAVIAIVAVLGALLGAMQLANSEFFQERLHNLNTVENRLGFLVNAIRMIRDHPYFGVGYFKFNEYRGLYNQAAYIPLYGFIKKGAAANTPIHDIYLGRMAEEGMVSTFFQFAFYFVIFKAFLKKWRSEPKGRWFDQDTLALFAAIMVCYLVGGMVIDYRYFDLVNVIFYFLAGLIYGYQVETVERA
jgi:O-antigen ligase